MYLTTEQMVAQFIATEPNPKYRTAVMMLYCRDFAPCYQSPLGRVRVVGRTTCYAMMDELGYEWNARLNVWELKPPF